MKSALINNVELEVKEYKGQRVVTFKEIDKVHSRPIGTANRNFKSNRKHLIDGEDYFIISQKELGTKFVESYGFGKNAPSGTLITESGYLMIVKSLTDDLAWQVQRELVKNYFRAKEQPKVPVAPVQIQIEKPYELVKKTYNSRLVMTLRDLEYITGISKSNLHYIIANNSEYFFKGIDYENLDGENMRSFKKENNKESSTANTLLVLYMSLIDKLIERYYVQSPDDIKILMDYFKSERQKTGIDLNIKLPFVEQIEACKLMIETLNPEPQGQIRMYKYIYMMNGLDPAFIDELIPKTKKDEVQKERRLMKNWLLERFNLDKLINQKQDLILNNGINIGSQKVQSALIEVYDMAIEELKELYKKHNKAS